MTAKTSWDAGGGRSSPAPRMTRGSIRKTSTKFFCLQYVLTSTILTTVPGTRTVQYLVPVPVATVVRTIKKYEPCVAALALPWSKKQRFRLGPLLFNS